MTPLLLSRTLDLPDYDRFVEELTVVDRHQTTTYEHRRWEHALALHALWRWQEARGQHPEAATIYTIGEPRGFELMLADWTECDNIHVLRVPLHGWVHSGMPLADVVTCLSVIEHVPDVDLLLYQLSCLLAPGGLLVLTMAYWNRCGPDQAHGHHERARIYCPKAMAQLRLNAGLYQLTTFGGVDPAYHGPHVHDYTLASLVLEKRK